MYALGNCSLKANFDARPVELILSTFQAALLLLFNNGMLYLIWFPTSDSERPAFCKQSLKSTAMKQVSVAVCACDCGRQAWAPGCLRGCCVRAEGGADQTLSYADVKERLNLPRGLSYRVLCAQRAARTRR